MTWKSYHRRGEILRSVIDTANARLDGVLPMDVPGVAETFGDELTLLAALQLRWHTRLAGRIERELMGQPMDLESAVLAAWQATADELPGIRGIVDHYRDQPLDGAMAEAMGKATAKEWILLAVMAGLVSAQDEAAVRVGEQLERAARAAYRPATPERNHRGDGLVDRIKAVLAA